MSMLKTKMIDNFGGAVVDVINTAQFYTEDMIEEEVEKRVKKRFDQMVDKYLFLFRAQTEQEKQENKRGRLDFNLFYTEEGLLGNVNDISHSLGLIQERSNAFSDVSNDCFRVFRCQRYILRQEKRFVLDEEE